MRDTPRTNDQIGYAGSTMSAIRIEFCRQLERELNFANERIKQLEHEIELLHEHADYEAVCLVDVILKGEEITRKENQNQK